MAKRTLKNLVQNEAYYLVFLQLIGVTLLALVAFIIHGKQTSYAVLLGGLVYVLPNFIFVWRVFRFVGARQITQFVAAFFIGEMLKMLLSAGLFVLVVKYLPVSLLSVLVGFMGAIFLFWIICLWHFSGQKVSNN